MFGYKQVGPKNKYFYTVIKADSAVTTTPTFLYLPGGPGGSSLEAVVDAVGPCIVSADGKSLVPNKYSWTKKANGIWVDLPGPTGFSEGPTESSVHEYVEHLYTFLTELFKDQPQLSRNLHLVGISADASNVALLAAKILDMKANIDLKGILIISGMIGPADIYRGTVKMAGVRRIVGRDVLQKMVEGYKRCYKMIAACQPSTPTGEPHAGACQSATDFCNSISVPYIEKAGKSVYDIRTRPGSEGKYFKLKTGHPEVFYNQPSVQRAIGVSKKWQSLNEEVFHAVVKYTAYNATFAITKALDAGLKVAVFNGDYDILTNGDGSLAWMTRLSGRVPYGLKLAAVAPKPLKYPTEDLGTIKNIIFANQAKMAFANVKDSGHSVILTKPGGMQQAVSDFFTGRLWSL